MKNLYKRIIRRITRFWRQPIRVFCFHQVSDIFDEESMWVCDWMSTKDFKDKILYLQKSYTFISLNQAHELLASKGIRIKKYAVLTADDGSKTMENILPWLEQKKIPVTLFINGSCLDGKTYRKSPRERYFNQEELITIVANNDLITIGHHGWEHKDFRDYTEEQIYESIQKNTEALAGLPNLVNYWAYPYGKHTRYCDDILIDQGFIPVCMDGKKNEVLDNVIHRELL